MLCCCSQWHPHDRCIYSDPRTGGPPMNLAVVTGAPGWLGTPLVHALAEGKKLPALKTEPRNVRCIVQPGVSTEPLKKLNGKVETVQADLRDARAVSALCEGVTTV